MRRVAPLLGLVLLLAACAGDQAGSVDGASSTTTGTGATPESADEPAGSTSASPTTGEDWSNLADPYGVSAGPGVTNAYGGDDEGQGCHGGTGPTGEDTPTAAGNSVPTSRPEDSDREDLPEPVTVTPPTGVTGEVPADLLVLVLADLAARAGVTTDDITVAIAESVTWPDGSLGCGRPGEIYQPVPVPGYRVLLQAAGTDYEYHLAESGYFVLC